MAQTGPTPPAEPRGWYPGERMARRRASHSYGFVLLLIVVLFGFTAAGPEGRWSQGIVVLLLCGTLVAALWTSGLGRAAVRPSIVLAGLSLVVAVVQIVSDAERLTGVVGLLNALLLVAVAVVVAVGVFDQQTVNQQSILGAICIYLLIGLLFTSIYSALAYLGSGDFFAQGTDGTPSLRLYFSYVTLATLGYGDYTADGDLGHTLAIVEALLGQLYLVTVVAVVVGRLHRPPVRS